MSGKWKRYPAYRESGIEWLGRIPVGWEIRKLKHSARFQGGGTPSKDDPRYWNGDIPWVSPKDMKRETVADSEDHITAEAIRASATHLIPEGAVLIVVRSGILKHSIPVAINSRPVALNQDMKAIMPMSRLSSRYLARLINGMQSSFLLQWRKAGATVESLEHELVASTPTPCPSDCEQRAIAAFLDRETAKIDALVAKKERLIELLQEKRTALISHAVTRGLNPNAPLRDSGIPWLGHIPEHWRTRRLAMVTSKITNGFVGPTRDILVDDGIRYLQSLHIKDGSIRFNTPYFVRPEWSADHAKSILAEGDVLIVQTGDLGQCAAVPRDFVGANCHALIIVRLRPHVGSGRFLSAFLRSHYGRASLRCCETGATLPHLECGKIREIQIAFPPEDEQNQIMNELEAMTAKLDALKAKIRTAIERLQEYRTALISAAVTGQIDVRGQG